MSAMVRRGRSRDCPGSRRGTQRPVRICFPFCGDSIGGSHVSTHGLLQLLVPARHRAIVVPQMPGGQIAGHFAAFEQRPDPVAANRSILPGQKYGFAKFLVMIRGLAARIRFLRQERFDIVHVNDGRTSAEWALAARLAGVKLVWHHRGDPDALGVRLAAPLLASHILAVSAFALPGRSPFSVGKVVHSPFDTALSEDRVEARRAMIEALAVPGDTIVLGFFGAFVPRKRPLLFVDAIAALSRLIDRPVIGAMFGEARVPEMDRALRDHIQSTGMGDRIRLMGHRSPGPTWIAGCDQLLVPAINEPFGRTLIEAMLVGTPVVASRSGGNVEALEAGDGLIVDADEAVAMARGCATLIDDPEGADAIARRAMRRARETFSAERHHAAVTAIYDELAGVRRP